MWECFVYYILEVGEMLRGGVGVWVVWRGDKVKIHVLGCDGMYERVEVLVS